MDLKALSTKGIEAKKQMLDAQFTLWNTRLEALSERGDIDAVLDHLHAPIEDNIDNCGCNVQCGTLHDGASGLVAAPSRG